MQILDRGTWNGRAAEIETVGPGRGGRVRGMFVLYGTEIRRPRHDRCEILLERARGR